MPYLPAVLILLACLLSALLGSYHGRQASRRQIEVARRQAQFEALTRRAMRLPRIHPSPSTAPVMRKARIRR